MEAAFFDLDKTVIAKSSMVAFGRPLLRAGLLSRRLVLRALYAQMIYVHLGADEHKLEKMREAALRVTKGWEQRRIAAIVRETLEEVVEPLVHVEALELIAEHRGAGRKVFIVSASPEEIVAPLAHHLGADEAVATRAHLDAAGCYSGTLERYCYGPEKARVLEEVAERDGIDLSASYAYSDSATDVPMLATVGHPVAVNPDRVLATVAAERGWEVRVFRLGVPLRERVPMPTARQGVTVGGGLVALGAASGVWWWLRFRRREAPWWRRPAGTIRSLGPSWPRQRRERRGRRAAAASSWVRRLDPSQGRR